MPRIKLTTRTCRGCNKVEVGPARYLTNPFCSKECWRIHAAGKHLRRGREYVCPTCKKRIYKRPGMVVGTVYCSQECYRLPRAIPERPCPVCGAMFRRRTQTCSYRCSKTEIRNPNWDGGRPNRERGRSREWRREVFTRDDYTCVLCKQRGGRLHSHHMDGFSYHPDRRLDVTNGVTLCTECHQAFHKIYGKRGRVTEANFREYAKLPQWASEPADRWRLASSRRCRRRRSASTLAHTGAGSIK